jgi:hypothetical protein
MSAHVDSLRLPGDLQVLGHVAANEFTVTKDCDALNIQILRAG